MASDRDQAEALNRQGQAFAEQGNLSEAIDSFRQALCLQPDFFEARRNLSDALLKSRQQAVQLLPQLAQAHYELGIVYGERGQLDEAVASYLEAVWRRPDYFEAYNNLGIVLREQNRLAESRSALERALQIHADSALAHNNLGLTCAAEGNLEEAIGHYRRALELDPRFAEAYNNMGIALRELNRLPEALASLEQAISIRDYHSPRINRALIWLLQGQLEKGLADYEHRFSIKGMQRFVFQRPLWDGLPLNGRTILLHAEQGLGDMLQFIRFARLVKERGGRVVVESQPPLVSLLRTCPGVDEVVPLGADFPPFDVHAPLLSLARILGLTLATIPAEVPYLFPDPARIEEWRHKIHNANCGMRNREPEASGPAAGPLLETKNSPLKPATLTRSLSQWERDRGEGAHCLKVGIAWQGDPRHERDFRRSIPLARFAPLAQVKGVQLFSLQKGPGTEQLTAVGNDIPIVDLGSKFETFMDAAACMKNLDLVITIDSAVAHCAGALGVPVWVALTFVPDWRWFLEREDSPWYPGMRLFRQSRLGEWDEVFERMVRELSAVSCQAANYRPENYLPSHPATPGEPARVSGQR